MSEYVYRILEQTKDGVWRGGDRQARHYVKLSTARSALGNISKYGGNPLKIQRAAVEWEDL